MREEMAGERPRPATALQVLEEIAPRIVRSLDAEEIVSTVAELVERVIDYHHFRLYRWDDAAEALMLVKSVARAEPYHEVDWSRQAPRVSLGQGVTGIAAASRRSVLVPDASQDQRIHYVEGAQRLVETILCVPMLTGDRLFGVMSLSRLGVRSMGRKEQRLLEAVAAQTALALANAERYADAQQTIQAVTTLEALDEASADEGDLHQRIAARFAALADADAAGLLLAEPAAGGRMHSAAAAGTFPPLAESLADLAHGPLESSWLADLRHPLHAGEVESEPGLPDWLRKRLNTLGVRGMLVLPLRARGELSGLLALYFKRPSTMPVEHLNRLQLVAAQAAVALDNRRVLKEERRRVAMLAELEKAQREFVLIASHELRTPLSVIRGYASLLEDGSLGEIPASARAALRTMGEKSDEMLAQVERMLFVARFEEGASPFQRHPVDVIAILRHGVRRIGPVVRLSRGSIRVSVPQSLHAFGQEERLGLVVDNLLQNAAKFTLGPPRIEVTGLLEDGSVVVTVRDHGPGIPEQAQRRLFEKFYRVDDPEMRHIGGTGLGLYLVKQVIDSLEGSIAVVSAAGEGTAVTVRLPAAIPDPVPSLPS